MASSVLSLPSWNLTGNLYRFVPIDSWENRGLKCKYLFLDYTALTMWSWKLDPDLSASVLTVYLHCIMYFLLSSRLCWIQWLVNSERLYTFSFSLSTCISLSGAGSSKSQKIAQGLAWTFFSVIFWIHNLWTWSKFFIYPWPYNVQM